MDITHNAQFGILRYIRGTIDTYSSFFMASAQTEEVQDHVINNCLTFSRE